MKRCSAKSYEKDEKYIFLTYAYRDSKKDIPIIERIAKDGYRSSRKLSVDTLIDLTQTIILYLNGCDHTSDPKRRDE